MLFNSFEFIFLFFPIVTFLYFFLKKKNLNFSSKVFLIIASLFFYSYWNIKFLPLIIFSVIINYFFYLKIFYSKKKYVFFASTNNKKYARGEQNRTSSKYSKIHFVNISYCYTFGNHNSVHVLFITDK